MASDPRKLRPSELCRLLNSTPLGEAINERQLHRHRTRAGMRIGDGRFVDLLRYVAWLVEIRHAPRPEPDGNPYEKLKDRARARNVAIAIAGRDIGELPAVVNPDRKSQAASDFRFFCDSYFPMTFHLPWSPDHLKVIAKIEQAVLRGGLFAIAMPRGSGKTTICECACIWAVLNGHREFVCLIGSDEGHAMDMLDSIKMELDGNDLLLEDYPEVVFPIQCLDGIANRCNGQLYQGERTHIGWTAREIVLPTLPGSAASGAIIKVAGITARIRGMKYKRADGQTVRPSLIVIDDPQTDESARSLSQCATRESILAGAILGLAGPGKKISGIMPCTVIRPDDMADSILCRDKHPEWHGTRTKMVEAFPDNEELWDQYTDIYRAELRSGGDGSEATQFYADNREAMDRGAVVSWEHRKQHDELSALQHAMNLRIRDRRSFYAEMQNTPEHAHDDELGMRTIDSICTHVTNYARWMIPPEVQTMTAFTDVQKDHLFWMVCGWTPEFTGYVIAYGAWPDQKAAYFKRDDIRYRLSKQYLGDESAMMHAALDDLETFLFQRRLNTEGKEMSLDFWCMDGGWARRRPAQETFVHQSLHRKQIAITHGWGVGARERPFDMSPKAREQRTGPAWYWTDGKSERHVTFDTNYWKTRTHQSLALPKMSKTSIQLHMASPYDHRMLAEHLHAETPVRVDAKGRTVYEWEDAARKENEGLDCLVGNMVAASIAGVQLPDEMKPQPKRRRLSLQQYAEAAK